MSKVGALKHTTDYAAFFCLTATPFYFNTRLAKYAIRKGRYSTKSYSTDRRLVSSGAGTASRC